MAPQREVQFMHAWRLAPVGSLSTAPASRTTLPRQEEEVRQFLTKRVHVKVCARQSGLLITQVLVPEERFAAFAGHHYPDPRIVNGELQAKKA